ncbi:17228_t:CDS:2 [Dentiscutata erythropus]|uniref:17228_t:CDS:1 n=1 Tax=Dentiscutata erythropus TaxID=1348616 RepID=A0A9N9JUS7_9GLOM|nr:17228_t:CDS:2 [Dentiscutata erythropus]
MSLRTKAANIAHKTTVLTLCGLTIFGFVEVGILFNRRVAQSRELATRRELNKLSQEITSESTLSGIDDNKSSES